LSVTTPPSFERAVKELSRLPGLGERTAERLVFHLLGQGPAQLKSLVQALGALQDQTRECRRCHHLCEGEFCSFCLDSRRDGTVICVVEMPQDLARIEDHCDYRGLYHVLGGRFSPLEGLFPEDLNLDTLVRRVQDEHIVEVVLALNPNTEGEATCELISRSLQKYRHIKLTRLATGLPAGSEIGFSGKGVLRDAFAYRRELR
jgi:recombination protein RecR